MRNLMKKAKSATKDRTKTPAVIAKSTRDQLASLYGSDPAAKAPPWRGVAR
jgi:hypothetical protein